MKSKCYAKLQLTENVSKCQLYMQNRAFKIATHNKFEILARDAENELTECLCRIPINDIIDLDLEDGKPTEYDIERRQMIINKVYDCKDEKEAMKKSMRKHIVRKLHKINIGVINAR